MSKSSVLTVIKRVLWGTVLVIFAILAIIAGWLAIDKFILKSPVPSIFGYATLTIETGSMSGELEIGDMILIKDTGDYKIGDIVTFIEEGDKIPTTHRIVNQNEDGSFVTKGDANNALDTGDVSRDMILGEVVKVMPRVGFFFRWVSKEGWLFIAAALLIAGLGFFILNSDDSEDNGEVDGESEAQENKEPEKQ